MSEALTANLSAISSLKQRIAVLSDCHMAQQAALREPSFANRRQQVEIQKEESEEKIKALNEELRIREDLADAQKRPGIRREIAVQTKLLIQHVKSYRLNYGSFQKASDPCFTCGASLRKLQNPYYGVKKDTQGKKKRRKERLELIRASKANAAKKPEGEAKRSALKTADEFARYMDAAEKAVLSRDVYHYTEDDINAGGAPTGYLRASENPDILKKYGIPREMLAPESSGFRAELYIPDQEVFGPDAKLILVFKGTTPSNLDDDEADAMQAVGLKGEYYERGQRLGHILYHNTGGFLEIAGHSLGACIGSAVGIATGCSTFAYNPAGLHKNTVASFHKDITSDASNVSSFVVDGEFLNSGQDWAKDIGKKMVDVSNAHHLPSYDPARFIPLSVGKLLSSVPTLVGKRTPVPCQTASIKSSSIVKHKMDVVIGSIEQEKRRMQRLLKQSLQPKREASHDTENLG